MDPAEGNNFRIVALGVPGSGKTIYLSALWELIGVRQLIPGVYFSTDLTEATRLRKIYQQASDSEALWPDRTNVLEPQHESTFSCSVRTSKGSFKVFDVTFIDYAGEWLNEADRSRPVIDEFERTLGTAHALLGVIDGEKLLAYLEGDLEGYKFFSERIRPFAEQMTKFNGPIHLVIMKWDLLQHNYSLEDVRDRLLNAGEASWLPELIKCLDDVQRRSVGGTVRLIPVSSMGNFVRLNEEGEMEKIAGRHPEPFNVEIPLVALVPDVSRWALDMFTAGVISGERPRAMTMPAGSLQATQQEVDQTTRGISGSGGQLRLTPLGLTVNLQTMVTFAIWLGQPVSKALGRTAVRYGRAARRQYRRRRTTELRRVRSGESALFYVARSFVQKLHDFEEEHRASVLQ